MGLAVLVLTCSKQSGERNGMNRAIRTLSDTQNLLMSNSDPSLEKKKKILSAFLS